MKNKILVVEDNKDFAEVLRKRLEAGGFEVTSAFNGEEALEKFKQVKPDLIVADLIMPVMDGYTMIRELRRTEAGRSVPIIVMTVRERIQDLCVVEGVRDYLVKPFEVEDLAGRINWNLKEKSQRQEGKRVLIVDDDEGIREMLKIRLEANGFLTSIVEDGEKAVQAVQKQTPDLVVMDIMMPNLDGFSTLKQINQMRAKKIPVVIITGSPIVWEDEFRMEGACAFIRKPVDGNQLTKQVKEILKV